MYDSYVTFSKICRIVKKNLIYEMTKDKKENMKITFNRVS